MSVRRVRCSLCQPVDKYSKYKH
ncbi:hypothetical protein EYD45_01810 [Hyunsoonleella flava]|uniref:Uncharacterized protein n=1 Tax=Hyunsoonleella flava TaxID=2527939 RepID=A0A4Q9FM57_9FLAO|nr:hypothetical protein EYD45_01810 [Hyunsoonleella flava]